MKTHRIIDMYVMNSKTMIYQNKVARRQIIVVNNDTL